MEGENYYWTSFIGPREMFDESFKVHYDFNSWKHHIFTLPDDNKPNLSDYFEHMAAFQGQMISPWALAVEQYLLTHNISGPSPQIHIRNLKNAYLASGSFQIVASDGDGEYQHYRQSMPNEADLSHPIIYEKLLYPLTDYINSKVSGTPDEFFEAVVQLEQVVEHTANLPVREMVGMIEMLGPLAISLNQAYRRKNAGMESKIIEIGSLAIKKYSNPENLTDYEESKLQTYSDDELKTSATAHQLMALHAKISLIYRCDDYNRTVYEQEVNKASYNLLQAMSIAPQ